MIQKTEVSVREELRHYSQVADSVTRKIEWYLTDLAAEIEYYDKQPLDSSFSVLSMNKYYETRSDQMGNELFINAEDFTPGKMIRLASGVARTPLTDETKRKLNAYEKAVPTMIKMYQELDFVDELWFFSKEQNIALGRIEYPFSDHLIPGLDLDQFYAMGLAYYDWFKAVDLPVNPQRRVVLSPSPFVELFNQWIMHVKAPVYRDRYQANEKLIGITSVHINLLPLMRDTIEHSNQKIMIVKDDSTLIGMNKAARQSIGLETYDISRFSYETTFQPEVIAYKRKLVSEILNLAHHEKTEDVLSFANKVQSEFNFTHTLLGKKYQVIKEKATELGFYYLALLDQE